MADLTLLVLAAGIGRRYQGLKQIEPVGPSGEAILDYAVYDALRSGFSRVVFVIRREIESAFRRATGGFWEERVPVSYVFQELEGGLPAGAEVPPQRRKPWGTAHAVLLCGETIATPFAAINADDFYGREAYRGMGSWLAGLNVGTPDGRDEFAFVGYPLKKTLSAHGAVSRGVCALDAGGGLREVVERVKIEKAGEGARALVAPGQCHRGQGPRPRSRILPAVGGQRPDLGRKGPGEEHPDAGIVVRDDLPGGCRERPVLDPGAGRPGRLSPGPEGRAGPRPWLTIS